MRSCPTCFVPYAEQVEFCGLDGTKLVFGETDLLIGKSIERYRIIDVVGDGGMARVYRAKHETLDREYALKVLYGEVASNKTLAERFRREAKTMSKISHENVVSVVDYGTTQTGLTFLSMELIEGETLRTNIKRLGCVPPRRAAEIARQIACGLTAAHRLGYVHRDLKPSNVMLVPKDGGVSIKLLDFGLVRATEIDGEVGFLTKTGQFVGTPIYMAPEQIIGGDVDPKADLYALGVVLYEMLEGAPPFSAKKLSEIRKKHLEEAPPRARPARGLEYLAADLLAKTPDARPEDASAVIARIDAMDFSGLGEAKIDLETADLPVVVPQNLIDTHAEARLASSIGSADERSIDLSSITTRSWTRWIAAFAVSALLAIAAGMWLAKPAEPPPEPPAPPPPPPIAIAPMVQPPPSEPVVEPEPKPKKAKPKPSDRAIKKAAAKRHLTVEDLARHPDTKKAFGAWSRSKQDENAQVALLEAIELATIDRAFVQAKLDSISARLAEASSKVPLTELRDLEDRYLQLMEDKDTERALEGAQKLLRDINVKTRLPSR
jgi:eukaryotic-like serine/threonine-protein kinase